jgi:prepilin-type N-terminal cleavage/methylation domain-containing protein
MRSSAPSTERRAGFTLVEVVVAASLFSVVLVLALANVGESVDAAKLTTVQSELRRTGERVMTAIVKDLRSTQIVYCGASSSGIEFAKVSSFDTASGRVILEGNAAGTSANAIGNGTIVYRYSQPATDNSTFGGDRNLGSLRFQRGPLASFANAPPLSITLTQELALPGDPDWPYSATLGALVNGGFQVSRVPDGTLPGLLTENATNTFAPYKTSARPITLQLKLVLKRTIGLTAAHRRQYAWATVDTMVQLRADASY